MARKNKGRPIKPDEVFVRGPVRFARYGKNLVYESNWPDDAFAEMQKRAISMYPEIVKEIDRLIQDIAKLVSELPADKLLHRAWWEFAAGALKFETEADFDVDSAVSMRMIDYIQSVIASVPRAEMQRDDVTEDEWQSLRSNVGGLFHKLNLDYQICRTAKAKSEDPDFSDEIEEFYYKAQMYWCNVRGDRYQAHEIAYLRDMFPPHSAVLQELFGIAGEQFVNELSKIWRSLTFGIQEAWEEMEAFRRDSLGALEAKLAAEPTRGELDLPALMQEVIAANGWQSRQERVLGRLLGSDLHDVRKVAALPESLIDELTWGPGEEQEFFGPGEFRGWPLRIWPIFKRPFVRLDGRDYCFDLHALFDHIYRVMQRIILRLKPEYRETWNRIQQEQSEALPLNYLRRILRDATAYRSVFYRWYADSEASQKDWCEADGVLVYDDYLFIVEVRAGAFTYTSPANDFPALVASLRNLVLKPATQGKRFLDYLDSAETVPLFDKDHNKVGEVCKGDFRQIVVCPVTLDPFTEMAAQVQHLRKIGVDVGSHPVWAISLDDLRVYADIFEDPLRFLHYVDQRMRAFRSDIIQSDDELDHLGLYLKHNDYSLHAKRMQGASGAEVRFTGYRSDIDKFFLERLYDPAAPCPLKQDTPSRILEILTFLSGGAKAGRSALSGYILDLDSESRQAVADCINDELAAQPSTRRSKPFSTHGDGSGITLFCYATRWAQRNAEFALDHTRAVLLVNRDERRLLLELSYADEGVLAEVHWEWVEFAAVPAGELPRLQQAAERLRATRVATAKTERRKIGRNEQCPCGSGKKYKKCCLSR